MKQKNIPVTFTMPESLNYRLHAHVEKMRLSKFVTNAIEKALSEEEDALRQAYRAANKDPDVLSVIKDWSLLDSEGWDD